jgi:hypothetical protein
MIWTIITMVALMGFVSLAIDFGRVQLDRTELQMAVDAAARYAVKGLSDATYVSKAQTAASANSCDGTAVSISSGDVVLGTWASGTFTSGGSSPNAIKVTAYRNSTHSGQIPLLFARTMGVGGCNIQATAIAKLNTAVNSYGVVGLNGVTMSNAALIDSYNSSSGSYSAGSRLKNGNTATNGSISMTGSSYIYGNAYDKTGYNPDSSSGVVAPGTAQTLSTTLSYPAPTLPSSYVSMGTYSTPTYGSISLTAGNYYFTGITVSGSCIVNASGAVNIYVSGDVNMSGAVGVATSTPSNVHLYLMGANNLVLTGGATLSAVVYAPSGTLNISNSSYLLGSSITKSVSLAGSGAIHVDEASGVVGGGSSGTGTISTVK